MALGRIPWHECVRYAEREGLEDDETESLIDLVEILDLEEHRLDAPKQKDAADGSDGSAGTGGGR